MKKTKAKTKVLEGVVTSDKMEKTAVVIVSKRLFHPVYKKVIVKRKKYKVHDEENKMKTGDKVKIIESRPYSKEKSFNLLEVIK
jgi:small subunit ribosomal protein S17